MAVVDYKVPTSIEEAVAMLAGAEIRTKVLAGGTDIIIQTRSQAGEATALVDLKHIQEMLSLEVAEQGLSLGPSVCCAEFTGRDDIKALYPGLSEAAYLIGSTQVQGRASIGGNLCNSSPAADTIPALIAVAARCLIAGPGGERTVAVEDFVTGVGRNCLEKGELLQRILIPPPGSGTADAYLRFIPRTEMDIAVAGAGVQITLDASGTCTSARVAIGAVAPTALLVPEAASALVGTRLDEDALAKAAAAAAAAANPITDRRGTVEFRLHVVGVLVKRAALIAKERAQARL